MLTYSIVHMFILTEFGLSTFVVAVVHFYFYCTPGSSLFGFIKHKFTSVCQKLHKGFFMISSEWHQGHQKNCAKWQEWSLQGPTIFLFPSWGSTGSWKHRKLDPWKITRDEVCRDLPYFCFWAEALPNLDNIENIKPWKITRDEVCRDLPYSASELNLDNIVNIIAKKNN